jgi:hypothetical protein
MSTLRTRRTKTLSPIYVVSGGVGASGEQLVQTVLAQFPDHNVPVITLSNVRQVTQLRRVIAQAKQTGGTIAHTLVDARLRCALIDLAREEDVVAIDLMGPLLSRLENVLRREAVGQPGLYRQFHRAYYERVSAIEFTMARRWSASCRLAAGRYRLDGRLARGQNPAQHVSGRAGLESRQCPAGAEVPPPAELFNWIAPCYRPDHPP